jgi:acyl-coenzyme A thioesterase PaaI-like protein
VGKTPSVQTTYNVLSKLPQGRAVFARIVSLQAPYFASIHPRYKEIGPHRAVVEVPKRRSVLNHIGTVHAIAVCNGLEAAMGMLAEATTPKGHRWLPKAMEVRYLAKSTSDITCIAETTESDWDTLPDIPVKVTARRDDGTIVVEGTIWIYVTPKV